MSPGFSLYLDLVRITAAFLVLLAHLNLRILSTAVPSASSYGHSAVVVFFVLSGYVISYVTDTREKSARQYAVSRISRIYSVLLPALVLAATLDNLGRYISPATYLGQTTHGQVMVRVLATLGMMNEPWGFSVQAFSAPFWSVSYEGWYYILFGLFTFTTGRVKAVALALASLVCGPKILLLMPLWLMGVAMHRQRSWAKLSPMLGMVLWIGTLAGVVLFHALGGPLVLRQVVGQIVGLRFQLQQMTWSGEFLGDYVLGLLVMLNFVGFRAADPILSRVLLPISAPIRWLASFTFSLYLYHRPLLLFYIALVRGNPAGSQFYYTVMALVLVTVVVLGLLTEHRKQWWRRQTDALLSIVERGIARATAPAPA